MGDFFTKLFDMVAFWHVASELAHTFAMIMSLIYLVPLVLLTLITFIFNSKPSLLSFVLWVGYVALNFVLVIVTFGFFLTLADWAFYVFAVVLMIIAGSALEESSDPEDIFLFAGTFGTIIERRNKYIEEKKKWEAHYDNHLNVVKR